MLEAAGRVVMVSGVSRGIGRAVLQRLLETGFRVSAGLRNPRLLAEAPNLLPHPYDAEDLASAEAWVAATLSRFGRIDALVNAAGINPKARLADADETALDSLWRVNVKGPMRLIRLAWPHLLATGQGRIVNIASLSGKRVKNENVGYAMSKHAVLALTHAARREGWEHGLRATALCPGFVDTDMTAHVTKLPRERMSRPEDLAVLVETPLRLPNTTSVAELLVNCQLEEML